MEALKEGVGSLCKGADLRFQGIVEAGSGNLTDFDGVWEQSYDPVNMAADRRPTPAGPSQWAEKVSPFLQAF